MNKTYRSIWNASLGCYVAAPESAVSHGAGTSRARAERAELPKQSGSAMVMEARIVFDGALLVTAIEQDSTVPAAEAPVAEAPVADHPADHPADTTTVATAEPTVTAPTDTTATAPAATTTDTGSTTEPAATTDTKAAATTEVSTTAADTAPAPLAVIAPAAASSHEIVFVDSRVTDISAFQGQGREVVVLTLEQDGLSQIADALAGRSDVDAIHIVSHGSDGVLTLGSTEVTTESIQSTQLAYLQSIGQSLTADGDILIYACDYAAGSTGLAAMDLLADITGADVAASTDTTGNAAQGGDWTLEQSTGTVDVQAIDLPSWQGELATYTGSVLASHLTISGSATSVSSDTIRLTPNAGSQSGAAQSTFEVALNTDFSLSFSVYLGTSDAGADGVTFIMHNDPAGAQALGFMGGGLGAQGIVDGVVIEFDTYYNGAPDLVNDHTAMWDSDNMSDILVGASDLGNIENGVWYPVTVTWTASTQTLSYSFNGVSMGSASGLVSAGRFGSGDTVHFGWTGATGGAMNDQEVRITSFTGAINFAPDAVDDAVTVNEEGATPLGNLMGNDSDTEGGLMSISPNSTTGSAGGTIFQDDSGNLVFAPGSAFNDLAVGQSRTTSFSYTLTDDQGATDTATVTVTVQGANDAPVAVGDALDVDEEGAAWLGNPLANDSDPDSSNLGMVLNGTTGSNGGSFGTDDSGNLIFVAGSAFDDLAVGQSRQTSITYTVSDAQGAQAIGTVTVTVHGANDAPVGASDAFSVYEDDAVQLGHITANDSDIDGGVVSTSTAVVQAGDNGGVFSFDDAGNLIFNPNGEFNTLGEGQSRSTSFQYTLSDGQGGSSVAMVTVTVQGMNDAPVAGNDNFVVDEDMPMVLGSLLANDSDADEGDGLSLQLSSAAGVGGGMFAVDDGGALFFIAGSDFDDLQVGQFRDTSYTYTVNDQHGGSTQAQVVVTVMGANDRPVGVADAYDMDANMAGVLGSPVDNDTDVEGDSLSLVAFEASTGSNGGIFSMDEGGNLSFDPAGAFDNLAQGESCETSFTYEVQDGHGGVASATVTVTVHGVAVTPVDPPVPVVMNGDAGGEPVYANEIVFVDARVPDPQSFAVNGREVVVLSLEQDGLAQMAAALSGRSGVAAVHIVSHGGDGYLTLGNGNIDANSVQTTQAAALQTVAASLTADGDILIYACDFASGEAGQSTLQLLAQYTSADVAASSDTTGDASLGGDWTLEATVGAVEATTVVPTGWVHTLNMATPVGTAVDKPVAQQIDLVLHAEPVTKLAVAGGDAQPVRMQRVQALEEVLRSSVDQSVAAGSHAVHSDLWALADSRPDYSALGAGDVLDVGFTDGAALGLRAQLSRWSAGLGQRPLTRGALRA
ncbi:DUF4347 domain-containing protein [Hydrogenophaga sp. MI9]|uniref:DUF4347 domain-containing protein n=1 Tax=Hydrogenophaga sp. MI9 TaxID=3453719 RepID=UPI003EEC1FEB